MKFRSVIIIFVLLLGICPSGFAFSRSAAAQPDSECYIWQQTSPTVFGMLGEGLTVVTTGQSVVSSVPTQFSSGAEHRTFGKHRSRTAFIRSMLRRYQPYFLFFRGTERCDSTPYSCAPPCDYYIFHLHRIKIKC